MENEDDKKRLEGFWKLVKAIGSGALLPEPDR